MRLVPIHGSVVTLHRLERRIQPAQRMPRIVKMHVRIVERAAVVGTQNEEAHDFGVVLLQDFTDAEEIAERLGHLFVVDANETVVHPVIDETALVRAFRLGDLVLVVRELQVLTAAVDVEVLAEQIGTHRRALDVPPRTAVTPR